MEEKDNAGVRRGQSYMGFGIGGGLCTSDLLGVCMIPFFTNRRFWRGSWTGYRIGHGFPLLDKHRIFKIYGALGEGDTEITSLIQFRYYAGFKLGNRL